MEYGGVYVAAGELESAGTVGSGKYFALNLSPKPKPQLWQDSKFEKGFLKWV